MQAHQEQDTLLQEGATALLPQERALNRLEVWDLDDRRAVESFPGGSDGQESACNEGDQGSIRGSGRSPGEGSGNPLQYSCLVGYNPLGCKELDTTELLQSTINNSITKRQPN